MLKLCLLLSLCITVTFANVCDDPNSEPKPCIDYCAPTCEEPQGKESCIEICTPGCDCTEGFVRDGDSCLRLSDCKNDVCANDPNTEFTSCGTSCPATCDQPDGPDGCGGDCVEGCFCKSGFVRNSGVCVPVEDCPNEYKVDCQDPNALYNECGSACPRTCEPVDEDTNCPDVCVPGCHCATGFVLHNGRCIDLNDCPTGY